MSERDVMQLIESVSQSLQNEIRGVKDGLQTEIREVKDGLQRIETRLDRIGGLVNGGSRALSRLTVWSENVDQMLADRDRKIEDLTRRIEKLEQGR